MHVNRAPLESAKRPPGSARIRIRRVEPADQRNFLAAVLASRALHRPWVFAPSTPRQFRAYVKRTRSRATLGFLVCERKTRALVGVINLSEIVLGAFRSAYLGYYAFAGFERQGLMREGLRAAVRYAFRTLKLHRLEANIQPANAASLALARSCGFSREGFSPRYLKIGGRWRDHERWAIIAS
ncbi:MAG TPA: GNAT family N-acetyltransferase [Burkholderiales bacterium]|nr:GNAT family N-acetyltransferase [Burkholderiales bacterium]